MPALLPIYFADMFKYLNWSFENYEKSISQTESEFLERLSAWLSNTDLFEQAWKFVCLGRFNWWWSEQLCLFTVGAWTTFVATRGRRHRVKHLWSYMILGQLVAISVALNLFNIALVVSPELHTKDKEDDDSVPPTLWASVFFSLITVALVPLTNDSTFLPNLLLMHIFLVLPLLTSKPFSRSRLSLSLSIVYLTIFISGLLIRTRTLWVAATSLEGINMNPLGFLITVIETLFSHPAQSSIGWDVIWTTVSFLVWVVHNTQPDTKAFERLNLIFGSLLVSIGVVAPDSLLHRERERKKLFKKN